MFKCLLGLLLFLPTSSVFSSNDKVVLEDFESYAVGKPPSPGWKTRGGEASGIYQVLLEGSNHYLHAKDEGKSVQFFRGKDWLIKDFPKLTWRWRVLKFPEGSDERDGAKNDSAAAVYVVFPKRFFMPQTIKYVWSANVPVDTLIARKDHFPTFVVRSGTSEIGKWQLESRNVLEDYQKHFHEKAPNAVAFGFLTDANDVKGVAEADYDDLVALKATTDPKAHP